MVVTAFRSPTTVGPGLVNIGIETDRRGAIVVDADLQTTRSGIYAVGDVTNGDQFVYLAAYGAKLAAKNAMGGAERYETGAMPWMVLTDPQLAGVNLTEAQAVAAVYEVKTSVPRLENVPRALVSRGAQGVIKLVADAKTKRLPGGVIAAPEGSDCIWTLVIVLRCDMTATAFGETVFLNLTTVEGLILAVQTFDKDVAKLSRCAE